MLTFVSMTAGLDLSRSTRHRRWENNAGGAMPQDAGEKRAGLTLGLLALALICEGFDLQIGNFAGADLMRSFNLTKPELAPFLSASLLGMLVGAPWIGRLGDRLGRRRVIVACTLFYGLASLLCAAASSFYELILLRLLTGVALGGALPNSLALASETAPERFRTNAVAIIGIGISLGGIIAGSAAATWIDAGWRFLFILAGVLPLAVAALLWALLPESRAFEKTEAAPRPPLTALFAHQFRSVTPAIWIAFILVLMSVHLLNAWSPVLLRESGFSPRGAALAATGYQAGAMAGSLAMVVLIGRRGWRQVMIFALLASAALAATALSTGNTTLVTIGLIATGFFVVGAQNGLNASTSAAYPTSLRATGLGWALGVGRLGSILGPTAGGIAASLGHGEAKSVLAMQVLPLLIAAAAAWLVARQVRLIGEDS